MVELMTYRRKGHAEHDNQSYVPDGEIERWERENDPITRYVARLRDEFGVRDDEIASVDERVRREDRRGDGRRRAVECHRTPLDALGRRLCRSAVGAAALVSRGTGQRRRRRTSARKGGAPSTTSPEREARLMAEITYLEAIREALFEEMERDANVFCLGEDIGAYGGAFKVTEGCSTEFGESRVIDTPISEIGIVGAAAGAAHMGMRPVVEMQFIDFIANAYDMLTNYVATARYRAFLAVPDGRARAERRIRARRAVPLAESRGRLHPHAGTQGRLSRDRGGREGPA